jgi:hypothetical protein
VHVGRRRGGGILMLFFIVRLQGVLKQQYHMQNRYRYSNTYIGRVPHVPRAKMQHCRMWRQTFSTTTAVPYAKISEAPAATELEVILTPTMALAPRSAACVFMRSVASARASLSKSV